MLGKTLISLKAMLRTIKHEGHGVYVELSQLEPSTAKRQPRRDSKENPKELNKILDRCSLLFQTPSELPPIRGHEHAIVLQEGFKPVNVCPYRYLHF